MKSEGIRFLPSNPIATAKIPAQIGISLIDLLSLVVLKGSDIGDIFAC